MTDSLCRRPALTRASRGDEAPSHKETVRLVRYSRQSGHVGDLPEIMPPAPNPTSVNCVGGQCRRSVSARPTRPARTYVRPFRSILFYTPAMDTCNSQFSTPTARPSFSRSRCQPRQKMPPDPENPRYIYTVSIQFREFQGGFRAFQSHLSAFQGL